jgi:CHAD domain-containing protein
MPTSTARDVLLRDRLDRFARLLQGVEDGDVNAIHRTRVASRRLREVLPVLQLDADVVAKLGRRLRKVTSRLGVVRELDVLLLVLAELRESGQYPDAPINMVTASIEDERDRARARMLAKLPLASLHRLSAKLEKAALSLESMDKEPGRVLAPPSWRWAIDARVSRRASGTLTAMTSAGALYLPERLHDVRIAVKKLRYALEVYADVSGHACSADLKQLRHVQDNLGRLHDLQVLVGRIRQIQSALAPPDLDLWRQLDRLNASIEDACRLLHGRYVRQRDSLAALCTRLSSQQASARTERSRLKRASR